MTRIACTLAALVGLAALLLSPATGPEARAETPVQLATGNDYKPFADESLPQGGLSTALIRAVYARLGQPVSVSFLPWKRAYLETGKGSFDATFPYVPTADRRAAFHFSDPLFTLEQRPLVRADSDWRADDVADLAGRSFCLPLGYALDPALAELIAAGRLTRHRTERMALCLRMLARGRVDFVPMHQVQGTASARAEFGSTAPVRFLDLTLTRTYHHLLIPRGKPGAERAMARFNAALAEIRADGTYDEIVARHLGKAEDGGV
jgi:polar amino acid transport system substrate-binding protein